MRTHWILLATLVGLIPTFSEAGNFAMRLERCTRTHAGQSEAVDCSTVAKRDLQVNVQYLPEKEWLTGSEKKRMFRFEENIGVHKIAIGAWKPDPVRALTVINVSLTEDGRGQVDYNEASFHDDKNDNYLSLALRSNTQGEYYRVKLEQKLEPKPDPLLP